MTITDNPVDNGVNVQALLGAREALSAAPEAAEFTWRASCTWRNGTHSHSTVDGFTGLGAEQQHRTTYEFDVDHPECFASEDNGATPVEIVLVGLVGCLTAGVAVGRPVPRHPAPVGHRHHRRPDERAGHPRRRPRRPQRLRGDHGPVRYRRRRLPRGSQALIAQAQKRSAVFDIVANPTKVLVELA